VHVYVCVYAYVFVHVYVYVFVFVSKRVAVITHIVATIKCVCSHGCVAFDHHVQVR
jgi:hypothetical protein